MLAIGDEVPVKIGARSTVVCKIVAEALCKGCGAAMFWAKTPRGGWMPVDPPADEGDELQPHWADLSRAAAVQAAEAEGGVVVGDPQYIGITSGYGEP
ncbi:MAG: hypothetical protein ACREEC_13025 [Thermoplasmata archaeon]